MRKTERISWAFLVFFLITLITCKTKPPVTIDTKFRRIMSSDIQSYHDPISLRIAWMPYENLSLEKKDIDNWIVVESDTPGKGGIIPVILVDYPNSRDSIYLDMNIENELLGKLVKHSLMSQQPISRPFSQYFEVAKCQNCHPADVKVKF